MRRTTGIVPLLLAVLLAQSHAKTPAQLKAAFQNVLPPGQKAQMAWVQKENAKRCIYVVDSDTGIIRRLTGDTMDARDPHITDNGTRVVFCNINKRDLRVVNWNGTNCVVLYTGIGSMEDYYRDPADKSEWAVTYTGGTVAKINIDTKQRVVLPGHPGDDGVRITPDGKYYVSDITGNASFGYTEVSTGRTASFCRGTCITNSSPDLTYRMSVQYAGHHVINICRFPGFGTGTEYSNHNIDGNIRTTYPASGDGYESTRWVAPDYFTFTINNIKPGPFLLKLSDPTKWVAVQDTLGTNMDQGFMSSSIDARIFTRTATGARRDVRPFLPSVAGNFDVNSARSETYLPDGRRLGQPALRAGRTAGRNLQGVVIRRFQGEKASASKIVVMQ